MDNNEMADWYDSGRQAMENFARGFVSQMQPVLERIREYCQAVADVLWSYYRIDGMPYGDSDEGMWRWAIEYAKVARLQREEEEIETHHRQMAALRQMIEKKGISQ